MAAALLIPSVRGRPVPSPSPAPAVSPLASAGRLHVELRRGASGEPEFHPLPPIPQGMALSAPASWPGEPPHGDASAGAEVAFLLTVAPDGSIISVARVGAPAAARDMVDTLEALLRQSRFVPYTAGEPATLALFVSVAGSGPER